MMMPWFTPQQVFGFTQRHIISTQHIQDQQTNLFKVRLRYALDNLKLSLHYQIMWTLKIFH
jgi:hypothetical protein